MKTWASRCEYHQICLHPAVRLPKLEIRLLGILPPSPVLRYENAERQNWFLIQRGDLPPKGKRMRIKPGPLKQVATPKESEIYVFVVGEDQIASGYQVTCNK